MDLDQLETTVTAIRTYVLFQRDRAAGKQQCLAQMRACTTVEELTETIQHVVTISDMWDQGCSFSLSAVVSDYLHDYVSRTLHHLDGKTSFQRLDAFTRTDPLVAAYIWRANFDTPQKRQQLGILLNVSSKNRNGFVRSTTVAELQQWMNRKLRATRTIYDDLPPDMKERIQQAERAVARAKRGTPLPGGKCYISSDAIQAAQTQCANLWRDADRWLAKRNK
ncbi:hypothetical protein EBZ80_13230 [bacterium]|nr:hypothetical protein [bacterium]